MAISSNRLKHTTQQADQQSIPSTINQIIASGQITRRQHLHLTSILLSNHSLTNEDRLQINRVLEDVQSGQLKLVN